MDLSQLSDEELLRAAGPISVRNNNPGNIRADANSFKQFDTPQAGLEAMRADLMTKINGGSKAMAGRYGQGYEPTLNNLISTYAPSSENNTGAYINNVARTTGLNPSARLVPQDLDKLVPAMIAQEGGKAASDYYTKVTPVANQSTQIDYSQMSDDDLMKAAGVQPQAVPAAPAAPVQEPDFFGRLQNDFNKRVQSDRESFARHNSGQQGLASTALQALGQGAGMIGDVALNAAGSLVRTGNDIASNPLAAQDQKAAGEFLSNSAVGRAVKSEANSAIQDAQGLAQKYPVTTANVEAGINLLGVKPSAGLLSDITSTAGAVTKEAGTALKASGAKAASKAESNFLQDLVTPKQTPKEATKTFQNSAEEGFLNSRVAQPTARQLEVMDAAQRAGAEKGASLIKNRQTLVKANQAAADDLITNLENTGINYTNHVDDISNSITQNMLDNPNLLTLGADGQSVVSAQGAAVAKKAQALLAENEATPAGILKARKQLDAWAKTRSTGVFERDSLLGDAVKDARNAMNGYVKETVPAHVVDVGASLAEQSKLYDALSAIDSKGAGEATNRLGRAARAVGDKLPFGGNYKDAATVAAAVGLGAVNPAIPLAAAGLYAGKKVLGAPALRKAAGAAAERVGGAAAELPRGVTLEQLQKVFEMKKRKP